jgi:hypothetical protein
MRLWTLHPRYLDTQGLTALWRESLLARAVIAGKTRGYTRHPQLSRFQQQADPLAAIEHYLQLVHAQSLERGYRFDAGKLGAPSDVPPISATSGQLMHEWRHLLAKLQARSPAVFAKWQGVALPEANPMFAIVEGPIEPWERA